MAASKKRSQQLWVGCCRSWPAGMCQELPIKSVYETEGDSAGNNKTRKIDEGLEGLIIEWVCSFPALKNRFQLTTCDQAIHALIELCSKLAATLIR